MDNNFHKFLTTLGFSVEDIQKSSTEIVFNYSIEENNSISVKYIYTPTEEDIFKQHQLLWNKNSDSVFIAVSREISHIINIKEKPDKETPLKKSICIKSFNYGVNSKGFENIDIQLIRKDSISSAYFFDFVSKNQKKGQSVDKDLLLNLLALRNDLVRNENEKTVHLLILRCLFIKYLEDREIFEENYITKILETGKPDQLINAFDEVAKINGDIFKFDQFNVSDIKTIYLSKLLQFFRSDYRSGQQYLFPYKFNEIPIQLISHVYEAFLNGSSRKGNGIYYTPVFLVNFMLSQSFSKKIKEDPKARILDPAVGSGAFLLEAFKSIQQAYGDKLDFNAKKKILEEQLFGIDSDANALQIAAFSLYLALLETESPAFIRAEIERANPILPTLIGRTLIQGNTILDDIFTNITFDCIVSNPPWGSIPTGLNDVYRRERNAIDNTDNNYPEYEYVADYERSQAFLMRVDKWGDKNTLFVMVVKNSIFLNDQSKNFRFNILRNYQINTFYELSHYNRILFKKTEIGLIDGEKIELGASEPCVVLFFQRKSDIDNIITYISPKLTRFSEHFELIHYTQRDKYELKQNEFIKNDSLWKILVNGDVESHDLIINKLDGQKNLEIEARVGFQPEKNMSVIGPPELKRILEPNNLYQFYINENLPKFNYNQKLRRRPNFKIFGDPRIVVTVRPLKSDNYLFRAAYLEDEVVHKHNILSIKLRNNNTYINNYLPYLGIINSKLIGFLFFQLSIQWGKGEGKRDALRNIDIERLPLKGIIDKELCAEITALVQLIQRLKSEGQECENELNLLDEIVFNLYGLVDYEKEIIKEFYDVRVKRIDSVSSKVKTTDIQNYYSTFKETFSLILSDKNELNASYYISPNLGAVICLAITDKTEDVKLEKNVNFEIINFIKSNQLDKSDSLKILFDEKVKIYDKDKFYIIKSNLFKDWTKRQAIKDAKEEIELFINQLSLTQ